MQSHQNCKKGRRTNLVREDESKEELDEEELQHPSDHAGSKSRGGQHGIVIDLKIEGKQVKTEELLCPLWWRPPGRRPLESWPYTLPLSG